MWRIKVRIVVNYSAPVFQFTPDYAAYLRTHGIEVRCYNAIYRIVSSQHRSHRKLLIIDGHTVITGGRNLADSYFDVSERYNFLDTDIEIRELINFSANWFAWD